MPGESHGQRSLVGYSPRGHKELDMTQWLSTHTLLGEVLARPPNFLSVYELKRERVKKLILIRRNRRSWVYISYKWTLQLLLNISWQNKQTLKPYFVNESQNQRHYCRDFYLKNIWRNWENSIPCAYLYLKTLINLSSTSRARLATWLAFKMLECLKMWYDHGFSTISKFYNFSKCISTKGRHIRVFSCPYTLSHDMALMGKCCQYWF